MSTSIFARLRPSPARAVALLAAALLAVAAAGAAERAPLTIETGRGPLEFRVELAATPAERARGLMFREALADDHGMLFDFGDPQPVTMWMRNTFIPLDIIFIKADGRISRIARDAQPLSDKVIDSGEPVSAVLELRGGVTAEQGIQPGDRVVHPLFE
jgi:uncharacterized protein